MDITDKIAKLIHDEIELAKAEVVGSVKQLVRGAVVGVLGAVFGIFGLIFLLHALAQLIDDALDVSWAGAGYGVVALGLFVMGGLSMLIAARKMKRGSHLIPEQAIAEARKTEQAIAANSGRSADRSESAGAGGGAKSTVADADKPATGDGK